MRVQVRYFAALREALALGEESLEVPPGTRAGDLLDLLGARRPALAAHRAGLRMAVGTRFVEPGLLLQDGDEVALIPPVSGG